MSDLEGKTLITRGERIYLLFISLYPEAYQKRFGQELHFLFQDLYQEEVSKKGKIGIGFWFWIYFDTLVEVAKQHIFLMKQQEVRKYFRITKYNILGAVFLLPFFTLFVIDLLGRIVQGDLTHYNRAWYQVISHTILYSTYNGQAPFLWLVMVFFPILAVLLNIIPVVSFVTKRKTNLSLQYIFLAKPLAIIFIGLGLFFLLVVFGHDFFPCMVHGLLSHGIKKFGEVAAFCRNA